MPAAALAENEPERLAALRALNLMDTPNSPEFDAFAVLASRLFNAPMSAISLVDTDRQWFKASVGLAVSQTPRNDAFCAHALLSPTEVLYVPDATLDPRFADNPLVTGDLGVRFYAGVPVTGPTGLPVGALCVIGQEPREATHAELDQLRLLGIGVSSALCLHASLLDARLKADLDPLTGLLHRAGFDRLAGADLTHSPGASDSVGLLLLDLDGFGSINRLFGHAGGDAALREVANRLRTLTRAADLVSRFDGDEFCILVQNVRATADLLALADRIHAALARPLTIEGQSVPLGLSIGVAVGSRHAGSRDLLIRQADVALNQAKHAGRGITHLAGTHAYASRQFCTGRAGMQDSLRQALVPPGREPFAVALQPIHSAETGDHIGFEALVRWPLPGGLMRLPDDFIPAAEATGLIVQLDRWMLDQACRIAADWPPHLCISSNLSAANFFAGNLVETVRDALARHRLAPHRLKLEITETVLLHDRVRIHAIITALKDLGVRVILDDFGAGHASLAYLRDYPFDGLKIDRSFTAGLDTDSTSRPLVRAIIGMSRALGLETTAEGVETPNQLAILRQEGVDSVQGYLLGRPLLADTVARQASEALLF